MNKARSVFLVGALMAISAVGQTVETNAGVAVAGKAAGSRSQTWAAAAWAADSKAWLVVWREGYLNEDSSEIWGARVDASGKALDPEGICLAKGAGLKDRPRVASDGKGWLVVWQDMRNDADPATTSGKGWDVYSGRVSGSGKALDEGGVMLAGGDHNQCRPDVAFAKGNYYAVWQGFDTGYFIAGTRVTPNGKALDEKPVELVAFAGRPACQAYNPSIAAYADDLLIVGRVDPISYGRSYMFTRVVDGATGQPVGPAPKAITNNGQEKPVIDGENVRMPSLALGDTGAMVAASPVASGSYIGLGRSFCFSKAGLLTGDENGIKVGPNPPPGLTARYGLAFDGKGFLLASDFVNGGERNTPYRMEIRGWHIAPDGKVSDDPKNGFVIAADAGRDQTLPSLAAGPDGSVLAVWSEVRGADDIKVMARTVDVR